MGTSIDLKTLGMPGWGWLFTGALLLVALGLLTLYSPVSGAVGIVSFSGTAFIISGISSIVLGFKLKDFKTGLENFTQTARNKTQAVFGHAAAVSR
jgi:uncharacterized membrane protein HdeD (DUF308 family)